MCLSALVHTPIPTPLHHCIQTSVPHGVAWCICSFSHPTLWSKYVHASVHICMPTTFHVCSTPLHSCVQICAPLCSPTFASQSPLMKSHVIPLIKGETYNWKWYQWFVVITGIGGKTSDQKWDIQSDADTSVQIFHFLEVFFHTVWGYHNTFDHIKYNKQLNGLVNTVKIVSDDIRMEFGLEMCAKATFKRGKEVSMEDPDHWQECHSGTRTRSNIHFSWHRIRQWHWKQQD